MQHGYVKKTLSGCRLINMETKKSYPNYIGKKIRGFKFESNENVDWLDVKTKYIGQIGEISIQTKNWISVTFEDGEWCSCPIELVEQHLVEEEPRLPKRGEEILVWDCEEDEPEKRIYVCYIEGALNSVVAVLRDYEEQFRNGETFNISCWTYWKPLPQVKKYTHKELEEKLGEKFIYENQNK